MKILHVIFDDAVKKDLVHVIELTDALSPHAENHLITNKHVSVPNAEVFQLDLFKWDILSIRNKFLSCLYSLMPDIVHVHGAWNYRSYQCLKMSHNRGFQTFFSPYGGITRENIKADFWKKYLWKLLWYQTHMVRCADYIVIESEQERRMINALGRTQNVILDSSQMMVLYKQAVNTKDITEVSVKTLFTIHNQLNELIHSKPLPELNLCSFEKKQYDVFCKQQNLTQTLNGTYITPIFSEDDARTEINKMVRLLKQNISKRKGTFNDVFQIATIMQNNDYNEDKLLQELNNEHLLNFARRIIHIADELCGIEMGFMPCLPLNDEKTTSIKIKLFNAGQSF